MTSKRKRVVTSDERKEKMPEQLEKDMEVLQELQKSVDVRRSIINNVNDGNM